MTIPGRQLSCRKRLVRERHGEGRGRIGEEKEGRRREERGGSRGREGE